MKAEEQIKAIAELDGYSFKDESSKYPNEPDWQTKLAVYRGDGFVGLLGGSTSFDRYLTSRDEIIPVIENGWAGKFPFDGNIFTEILFERGIKKEPCCTTCDALRVLKATPDQLCEALLRATGKWIESK
jgi:hypothetical protein